MIQITERFGDFTSIDVGGNAVEIWDRQATEYIDLLHDAFSPIPFTPGELFEIGSMLHGLSVEQSSQERLVVPSTTDGIRKRIRYKLGAASLAGAMDALCLQAFTLVPPLDDDMVLLMGVFTPAEGREFQMVAAGLTTNQSAELRKLAYGTVHTQRAALRLKRAGYTMAEVVLNDYRLQAYQLAQQ